MSRPPPEKQLPSVPFLQREARRAVECAGVKTIRFGETMTCSFDTVLPKVVSIAEEFRSTTGTSRRFLEDTLRGPFAASVITILFVANATCI